MEIIQTTYEEEYQIVNWLILMDRGKLIFIHGRD